MTPYLIWIKMGVAAALLVGAFALGHHQGAKGVMADWVKSTSARLVADNTAILKRTSDNAALKATQAESNRLLTKAHDAEIDQVRATIVASQRLRIGSALCSGPASASETASPGSGDATDSTSRALSEGMDRDIKTLILETEQIAATGRAAQAFITKNGLAP